MDKWQPELDRTTDQATQKLLIFVIQKKQTYIRLKTLYFYMTLSAFLYGLITIYLLNNRLKVWHEQSILDYVTTAIDNRLMQILFFIGVIIFGAMKITFEKKEKAEKDLHALRTEIIDRSKDLWKGNQWKDRHIIFEKMKKDYDINLYHESK